MRIKANKLSAALRDFEAQNLANEHPLLDQVKKKEPTNELPNFANDRVLIPAAVLILFIDSEDIQKIVFTKRTEMVKTHKGQISFPGGAYDEKTDLDLAVTALRETEEEIGISHEQIDLIGHLADYRTITNFKITPFVGLLRERPSYRPNPEEVENVFELDLTKLLDESIHRIVDYEIDGHHHQSHVYHYNDDIIVWGATAWILSDLLAIIRRCMD